MRFIALISLTVPFTGCAIFDDASAGDSASARWKVGDFGVDFQAGPRGRAERSYSYYRIRYTAAEVPLRELVMESAHSLDGFECVTNGDPKKWIRIIPDPSGKALLIEEEIPNDCGPCSNYLWVHMDSDDLMQGTYLQIPSKVTGPPGQGIDYEYPHVIAIDGNQIKFSHSSEAPVTRRIDLIEKSDRPTPPG